MKWLFSIVLGVLCMKKYGIIEKMIAVCVIFLILNLLEVAAWIL